ncbi:MAG: TVP38/TMEM64 family protein [Syntrophomonas sp.]|nr:TVP38/TMEM64 family protein [Syntrophomonas sp.]MDD4626640.1 TVP38/TMEM64 family protein [Syntrophomonas sp.]
MDKKVWKQWWFKIALLVIPVLLYYLVPAFQEIIQNAFKVLSRVDVDAARDYILSFGIWAPVVSFFLMVFQSVAAPLPAFVITFANAGLFGWVKGAALSWSSAMVGAILCFVIARLYGRAVVEKFTTRRALKEVDVFFEKYGKWAVLIARLLPFVSFDIVSYAAGLTAMGWWEFIWATGLGQLPATLVYSYVGDMLVGSVRNVVFGLLMLFALTTLIIMARQIWRDRNATQTTSEEI